MVVEYLKIACNTILISLKSLFPTLLNISEEEFEHHINICFRFYTFKYYEDIPFQI